MEIYKITTSPQSIAQDGKIGKRFDEWLTDQGVVIIDGGYGNSDLWVSFASELGSLKIQPWFDLEKISEEDYKNKLNR